MKRYFLKTLQDTLLTWVALAVGIIATSILYATLNVAGLSENTSLLIAFTTLVALIILGLLLAPKSLFKLRTGTYVENQEVQIKGADPKLQPDFISEIREVIPTNVRPNFVLSENGMTATAMLPIAQSQVLVTIKDFANIVLSSSELTAIVFAAIIRASTEGSTQGIKAISLTIGRIGTELEILSFQGAITRRLKQFEITVAMYSAEKARAQNSSYDSRFIQEWLARIEDSFYSQMAGIVSKKTQRTRAIVPYVDQVVTYMNTKYYEANVWGKLKQIEADLILERGLGLPRRRKKK